MNETNCANGEHLAVPDYFSRLPGVTRAVPGDVICRNCKEPLPYWWRGRAQPVPADKIQRRNPR